MHNIHVKAGDAVSIRHYSGVSPFKSVVLGIGSDVIVLKLTKDFAVMNFLEGDPVVLGFEADNQVYIYGCNISRINAKEGIIELLVDKIENDANKREHERYPVSLYADIRLKGEKKKHLSTIKDISYHGMRIYSRIDMPVANAVEIDIYMDKSMVFLQANIMRKAETPNYFEYGLAVIYEDSNTLAFMKDYIRRLMEDQEDSIRRLKSK